MKFVFAFVVGGLICVIGQLLIDKTGLTPARILTLSVVSGVVLSALGLYQPLVDLAGAGATVPISGFGNLMIFQYGRTLPEYNQPAGPTDGYASFRGQATSVRLLEPAPRDTEEA